jgi:hypothetical protein
MNFLFLVLCVVGEKRTKKDWMRQCHKLLVDLGLDSEVHLASQASPDHFVTGVFTTRAMLSFYAATVEKSIKAPAVDACAKYLQSSLHRAIEAHQRLHSHEILEHGSFALGLAPHARVSGLCGILQAMGSKTLVKVCALSWQVMLDNGSIHEPFDQSTHALVDVLHFFVFLVRDRRTRLRRS